MSEPTDPADRVVEWRGMSDYRRLPDGTWTETHWTFAPNSQPVRSAAPEEKPMSDRCQAELCPMWTGDGCACRVFGIDPPPRDTWADDDDETDR